MGGILFCQLPERVNEKPIAGEQASNYWNLPCSPVPACRSSSAVIKITDKAEFKLMQFAIDQVLVFLKYRQLY
jgi:hypothetical protein